MARLETELRELRLGLGLLSSGDIAVCCHGRIDSTTAAAMRETLREIETSHRGDVVIVADGIESIDREGVGVLVAALRRLRVQNRDLFVTIPSPMVLRALRVMKLHRVLVAGGRLPMGWEDPCVQRT